MKHHRTKSIIHDQEINYYHWQGESEAIAVVNIVHGLGEHAVRYEPVIQAMQSHRMHAYAYDRRGHGLSGGKRGHAESWEALMDEIDHMLKLSKGKYPKAKQILYGHSMGGNLTLNYLLERRPDLDGAIVSSPWIKTFADPPDLLIRVIHQLAKIFPKVSAPNGLKIAYMSRDDIEVNKYRNDPLTHPWISFNLASIMFKAAKRLQINQQSEIPILMMHGSADKICIPSASKSFANQFSGNITYKLWPGYYHEIHHDLEKDEVIREMIQWIENL